MRVRRVLALMVCAAVLGTALQLTLSAATTPEEATAVPSTSTAVKKALKYFRGRQTKSGGFSATGTSQAHITPWVVMAIKAGGQNPAKWRRKGGRTPIQYMQRLDIERLATRSSPRNPANTYAKFILAYKAARTTSLIRRAGKKRIDLRRKLLAYQNTSSGRFSTAKGGTSSYASITTTAYAILALKAANYRSSSRTRARNWLRAQANSDGGFSWNTKGSTSDVDTTAAVVMALRASGVSKSSSVIKNALRFLKRNQQRDGGFKYYHGGSTTSSTALAMQSIVAAGQNPNSSSWKKGGKTPNRFLRGKQKSNGSFYHLGRLTSAPLLSTSHAVMGLKKKKLPL